VNPFWQVALGLFAAGGVLTWLLLRWRGIGTRRADWGLSAVLFGWFFASVGVAIGLMAGYLLLHPLLEQERCRNPDALCGLVTGLGLLALAASVVPLGIGAFLLGFAPRR
jgi:hypothetical protein